MPTVVPTDDLDRQADNYAARCLGRLLTRAVEVRASDIHLTQQVGAVGLHWRVNGRLLNLGSLADGVSTSLLGRVKALAGLVTYRTDVPQEGRLILRELGIEARVCTLPTIHGERAVIRLATRQHADWLPTKLGLPPTVLQQLTTTLDQPSGVILITGPAGSGKTTTAYACVRSKVTESQPRSIVTLEDPVETELAGVAQSQVDPSQGYDWSTGLKAILRQDPEIMFVGEIRDAETAAVVFQAALTGQLVLSTMHARSAPDALRRLLDFGVPTHHLLSGLDLLLCQRLLPRRCACQPTKIACSSSTFELPGNLDALNGTPDKTSQCNDCGGSGVSGRKLFCELLPPLEGELAKAVVQGADSKQLRTVAESLGMVAVNKVIQQAIAAGDVAGQDAPLG